ncbi:LIC12162 family protein [Actinomycetota bacterium]|nr:LIC12162 family protein [Actinomycetota bacterium]
MASVDMVRVLERMVCVNVLAYGCWEKGVRLLSDREAQEETYLVTTALEETWPNDRPILFLGEWCLRYSRRDRVTPLDHSLAEYFWADRSRIPKDVADINRVYEGLLGELSDVLNQIHDVNFSKKYWRIVLGGWLFFFAQVFFDRWQAMTAVDKSHTNLHLFRRPVSQDVPAPHNMFEFLQEINRDEWNERLYADIAERCTAIRVHTLRPIHTDKKVSVQAMKEVTTSQGTWLTMRRVIRASAVRASAWLCRRRIWALKPFSMHAPYLRLPQRFKLEILLRQIPMVTSYTPLSVTPANLSWRSWRLHADPKDLFQSALASVVPEYLPTCYLEGYRESSQAWVGNGFPSKTRVILTANSFLMDERWKYWAASRSEVGTKIVIAQHGGGYGVMAWTTAQMSEIAMSDRYLSWGWSDADQPLVCPVPATRLVGMKKRPPKRDGICLHVTTANSRYHGDMASMPIGPEFKHYLDDQVEFAASLSTPVRTELIVRVYPHDYGWDLMERWKDADPEISVDNGSLNFNNLLKNARLCVATYNGTTFLESFTQDIPTVIFWNPKQWELAEAAKPYFELLRQASILFDDPVSCAEHINTIWEDVPGWWSTPQVSDAVRIFCAQYAYVGRRPLRELRNALRDW